MATWEPVSYYYSGQGVVLLGDNVSGASKGLLPVGNVSDLRIAIATSVLEHKESTTGARGIDLRLTTEIKATLTMTVENFIATNLATALRGTSTTIPAETTTPYNFNTGVAVEGAVLALPHVDVNTVVVKDVTDTTTYVLDTDYRLNAAAGSIEVIAGAGITTDDVLHISYKYGAQELVDAMDAAATEKYMRFEGLNTADGNNPVVVEVFRFLADPLRELALIGDGIGQFVLEGNILADNNQVSGSKYFKQMLLR